MGKRDFRWRESKKAKKKGKETGRPGVLPSPAAVEVIKKGKKAREEEEE